MSPTLHNKHPQGTISFESFRHQERAATCDNAPNFVVDASVVLVEDSYVLALVKIRSRGIGMYVTNSYSSKMLGEKGFDGAVSLLCKEIMDTVIRGQYSISGIIANSKQLKKNNT